MSPEEQHFCLLLCTALSNHYELPFKVIIEHNVATPAEGGGYVTASVPLSD